MHLNIIMHIKNDYVGIRKMRTTIELSDDLISILRSLAVKKGYRGYSKLIEEAVDFYFKENERRERDRGNILKMKGSWNKKEAEKTKKRLEEIRRNWNI
jgi:metal-responsive CopG/Arc/MetJ family transcriptional regulator